jgi:hypothetical protein
VLLALVIAAYVPDGRHNGDRLSARLNSRGFRSFKACPPRRCSRPGVEASTTTSSNANGNFKEPQQ